MVASTETDVTVHMSPFEWMQVQQALGERIVKLNETAPSDAHPLESATVLAGRLASHSALRKVVDALYPDPEPASLSFELV